MLCKGERQCRLRLKVMPTGFDDDDGDPVDSVQAAREIASERGSHVSDPGIELL